MREQFDMRILAYVLMPNHWHLLLHPQDDGDLSRSLAWLGTTHTRRYHAQTETIGGGHLYQGRYKSFLVQNDTHLLTVLKYIERNPVRAKLKRRVEEWRWGSAYRRITGTSKEKKLLAELPVDLPRNYRHWVNEPDHRSRFQTFANRSARGCHTAGSRGVAGWSSGTTLRIRSASPAGRSNIRPQKYQ
jgi:putative transposase